MSIIFNSEPSPPNFIFHFSSSSLFFFLRTSPPVTKKIPSSSPNSTFQVTTKKKLSKNSTYSKRKKIQKPKISSPTTKTLTGNLELE